MVRVEWSLANDSPPTLSYIRTTLSTPATAAFDFDSRSFTTLDVELPAWDTIPEVREIASRLSPRQAVQLPPEVLEQLRRASQFQLPPDHPDDELGQSDGDSDSSIEEDEGYEGTDGDQPPESPE